MARQLRFAFRQLRKTPGFTAIVLLTLGLCIGANTAIYSVLDAVLLRPAPYPEIDRLALVETVVRDNGAEYVSDRLTGSLFEAVREGAPGLDCAAFSPAVTGANFAAGGRVEFVPQQRVSAAYFRVLGVQPQYGREFSRADDAPHSAPVAVVSDAFWRRELRGDRNAIGAPILLKGEPYTVIGIMPASFRAAAPVDVWTPLKPSRTGEGDGSNYGVIARLRPEVSWAEAGGQLQALSRGLMATPQFARSNFEERIVPYQTGMTHDVRRELWITWGAVLVVLLIGCVNIAALLLVRSGSRAREIATRMALGGTRAQIVRQLLLESLLLALGGCVAGFAVGAFSLEWLKRLGAEDFALWHPIQMDARVMVAMLGIGILTSLLFGLVPALQTSRLDIRSVLVEGRGISGSRSNWGRQLLVTSEIALSLVLLVGAGLLARTVSYLYGLKPGFDAHNVMIAQVSLQDARYTTAASVEHLFETSLDRLRRTPGVRSAAAALSLPYERPLNIGFRVIDGNMVDRRPIEMAYVTADYFETLRIPVYRGRAIEARDTAASGPVAVVSQAFARKFLGGANTAIGRHIDIVGPPRTVIGVVGDVQQDSNLDRSGGPLSLQPMVYVPASQVSSGFLGVVHTWFAPKWVVRTDGRMSAARLRGIVQAAMSASDAQLPVSRVQTIEELREHTTGTERYLAALFSIFAALAVVLAALGLYGLISNSVAQRRHELGVRMALGATAEQTIASVVRPAVVMAGVGVVAGIAMSLGAGRLLAHHLWGVKAADPLTFVTTSAILLGVALLASVAPALRILALDPARTLRQ